VFHFHLHVIPRRQGDAIGPGWDAERADDRELVEVQARMLAHLREAL
jgi:diadenosine tetraphosphate (Ap4A) HIT family hydrolase